MSALLLDGDAAVQDLVPQLHRLRAEVAEPLVVRELRRCPRRVQLGRDLLDVRLLPRVHQVDQLIEGFHQLHRASPVYVSSDIRISWMRSAMYRAYFCFV